MKSCIAEGPYRGTQSKALHCKCFHILRFCSAFPTHLKRASASDAAGVPVLASAAGEWALSLVPCSWYNHDTELSGTAPQSPKPCHLAFASENHQGNASNHLRCKHSLSQTFSAFARLRARGSLCTSDSLSKPPDKVQRLALRGTSFL